MALLCAICEDAPADSVCHHCSKPVCAKDRMIVNDDPAFRTIAFPFMRPLINEWRRWRKREPLQPVPAVHCRACKAQYHPGLMR